MSYRVKYEGKSRERLGIFQGEFLGMGFWHPISEQPEQGICRFKTIDDAEKFIKYYLLKEAIGEWYRENFIIEPFDEKLNFEMQLAEIEEK